MALTIKLHETKFDPSQYDFFQASYTLDGNDRTKNTNGIVDAQGTLEMAQRHGATNLKLVGVKDGKKSVIPLESIGIKESKNEAMSLKGFLEALEEKLVKQFDLDEDKVKAYLDSHTQEMQELLDDKELSLKEKVLFVRSEITGEKDESKKSESIEDDCKRNAHDILNYIKKATGYKNSYLVRVSVNDDEDDFYIKYNLGTNGNNYILYAGVTDYSITDLKGENTYVEGSTDLSGAMTRDLDAFCEQIKSPKKESKEPADEKLGYEKGHKNSKGEDAPWVIRSHEDNRILASFANKKDAEEHLKRMKQYSKKESRNSEDLKTYACFIDFATEDDAKKGMEIVKGWHPFRNDTAVLIDSLGENAANRLWNDWKQKCAKAGLAISDAGEVYKEEPTCFYGNESKQSESKNLSGYTSDIISKLDEMWACGLNGAKRLAEKYADVIQQNYTDGDLSTTETAKFIAGQENLTESRKKTESKQSEVHLELIDTIIVPKWLWEAHTFGNEYGEDLDEHEQEILAKFEEEYGKQYYLDDRSEEADFRSRNDFDEYGGPCYEVDVYKMS